jgi:hypothetical protein
MWQKHTIDISDITSSAAKITLASSGGEGSNKRLEGILFWNEPAQKCEGFYRVTDHNVVIAETPDLRVAIAEYNDAR